MISDYILPTVSPFTACYACLSSHLLFDFYNWKRTFYGELLMGFMFHPQECQKLINNNICKMCRCSVFENMWWISSHQHTPGTKRKLLEPEFFCHEWQLWQLTYKTCSDSRGITWALEIFVSMDVFCRRKESYSTIIMCSIFSDVWVQTHMVTQYKCQKQSTQQ